MQIPLRLIRLLISASAVSLLATSCATFPKNQLPKVSGGAPTAARKVSLTYSITSGSDLTGSRKEGSAQQNAIYGKSLVAAAEKSGRFSSVKNGKGGAVHVDVDMLNHGNGAAAAASGFISGFTFTIIPGVGTDQYKLTANARGSSGKSRRYVLEDGATIVIWLPMIFAMPTNHPADVVPKVHENMFANLVAEMEKDGLLK